LDPWICQRLVRSRMVIRTRKRRLVISAWFETLVLFGWGVLYVESCVVVYHNKTNTVHCKLLDEKVCKGDLFFSQFSLHNMLCWDSRRSCSERDLVLSIWVILLIESTSSTLLVNITSRHHSMLLSLQVSPHGSCSWRNGVCSLAAMNRSINSSLMMAIMEFMNTTTKIKVKRMRVTPAASIYGSEHE
jgi:hypothetical protein